MEDSLGLQQQQQQQQHRQLVSPESRARSLGRSRSRGRNPSELLARKQQLLSANSQEVSWSAVGGNEGNETTTHGLANEHQRRSQVRRAFRYEPSNGESKSPAGAEMTIGLDEQRAMSVEAKLESLSELVLKSHQEGNGNETALGQQAASLAGAGAGQAQTPTSAKSIDDVYILLAKKEKDLQLAAELGKVLLEKNDELSKANERITEDYSHKLELLEQDKHRLKRKLDLLDGEYENRLIELQTDCNILKNQLDEQQQLARQTEKEKSKLIDDLVQQNQRLTSELIEATKSEELLSSQLEQMNERFNVRMSNRQDHVAQLDALKEEILIVNQRKQDLERRLKLANNDKTNLNTALDESGDKILLLENLLNEKDAKLGELMIETNELRDSSSWLSNELEAMISLNEKLASSSNTNSNSQATDDGELQSASERKRSQLVEQLKHLRLRTRSRLKANEFILSNRRSGNQLQATPVSGGLGRASPTTRRHQRVGGSLAAARARRKRDTSLLDELESSTGHSSGANRSAANTDSESASPVNGFDGYENELDYREEEIDQEVGEWNEELMLEVYALLRSFHTALQNRKDALVNQTSVCVASNDISTNGHNLYSPNSTTDDSGISSDDVDKTAVGERRVALAREPASWKRLLTSLKALIEEMPCSTCQLMIAERASYEQLQKVHAKLREEMRRKEDQLLEFNAIKTEQAAKLSALEERCAILSDDLKNCDKPKEEIVKLAWKARDEAVERKNNAEISLAKTRIENMQIASQLMEVVQQKGELSQKLAQFEDDIHYITQDSVKAKFTWEEQAEQLRRSKLAAQPDSVSSNPLAQLLSFSVASSKDTATATATANKSSAMDNLAQQPASLMRNFTSSRFNLRFWQRSSSEKQPPATPNKGSPVVASSDSDSSSSNNNNNNNSTDANGNSLATKQ